jgi:hypothetical protein
MSTAMAGSKSRAVTAVNYNPDVPYFPKVAALCHVSQGAVEVWNVKITSRASV